MTKGGKQRVECDREGEYAYALRAEREGDGDGVKRKKGETQRSRETKEESVRETGKSGMGAWVE